MQSRKTNAKINQFKHQHTEIFTLGKNHSRPLSKYNGWRKKISIENNAMKMGSFSTGHCIFYLHLLACSKIK